MGYLGVKNGGSGQADSVLNAAGLGSKSAGVPEGGGYVEAEGALSASCRSLPISRGKGNVLAQEHAPPPAVIDGADIIAAARRKQRQGNNKNRLQWRRKDAVKQGARIHDAWSKISTSGRMSFTCCKRCSPHR